MKLPPRLVEIGRTVQRDPLDLLYPEQRVMVESAIAHGARIADHSGRGSGKTEGLVHGCQRILRTEPGARIAWIGLTRNSAVDNCWPAMMRVNRELGGYLTPRTYDARWMAPDGGMFAVFGANKADELEKLRGQAYRLVVIDESASFKRSLLKYLVEDVIEPRLVDHDGGLAVIGSPGAAQAGYYYEVCQGKGGFRVFRRTMLTNPHFKNAQAWLARQMERKGWDDDHPTYRREYLGEWVKDESSLVYRFARDLNIIAEMPDGYAPGADGWGHLLSHDYGVVDSTAWVIWAWKADGSGDRRAFVPFSWKWHAGGLPGWAVEGISARQGDGQRPGDDLAPSDAAIISERLRRRFRCGKVVGDTGGIGKGFAAEARKRFGLAIQPADKVDKAGGIELLNDGLRNGAVQLVEAPNGPLVEELETVQWKVEQHDVSVGGVVRREDRKVVDPRFEDHVSDAARYGYPEAYGYTNRERGPTLPELEAEDPGEAIRREHIAASRRRQEAEWWDR